MADLFNEIIPAILQTKQNVLEEEKDYVPFIVNRALSYHYDCIMFANEMNRLPNLDRKLQFDFYINTIRSYKRPFQKWQKRETVEDLEIIKEYFNYSNEKAKQAMTVLTSAQIDEIRTKIYKGGSENGPKHRRTIQGANRGKAS